MADVNPARSGASVPLKTLWTRPVGRVQPLAPANCDRLRPSTAERQDADAGDNLIPGRR